MSHDFLLFSQAIYFFRSITHMSSSVMEHVYFACKASQRPRPCPSSPFQDQEWRHRSRFSLTIPLLLNARLNYGQFGLMSIGMMPLWPVEKKWQRSAALMVRVKSWNVK